jgi:predicted aspartyl protease
LDNSILLNYDSVENLICGDDGHYHLTVPAFYEKQSYSNRRTDFVFDTGAFITVMTRNTAERLRFFGLPTIIADISLNGFVGGCLADIKEIPRLLVGSRFLDGVKVAIPRETTETNILGLNVIEYFKYFIDTENDKIYFAQNPQPNIPAPFRCNGIRLVSK